MNFVFLVAPLFVTFDFAHMFFKAMMHCYLYTYKKNWNKYRLIKYWTIVLTMYQKLLFQSIDATVKKQGGTFLLLVCIVLNLRLNILLLNIWNLF